MITENKENEINELMHHLSQKELEELLSLASNSEVKKTNVRNSITKQPRKIGVNSFPASFNQEWYWILNNDSENDFLNVNSAYTISGSLNIDALEKTLNEIVKRHENLHTIFSESNGVIMQHIVPFESFKLPVVDISDIEVKDQNREVEKILHERFTEPYDLSKGPLVRFLLVRLAKEKYVIWMGFHHILIDGWGLDILLNEIRELYSWFAFNKMYKLPEIAIQCADYSVWQRDSFNKGNLSEKELYWKNKLSGYKLEATLPLDFDRPVYLDKENNEDELFYLSKDMREEILNFTSEKGISLFMLLLSALNMMIYAYTKNNDIIIVCPISSRNQKELENLICDFSNTLPYRTLLEEEDSIEVVLRKIRETAIGLYRNQLPSYLFNEVMKKSISDSNTVPLYPVFFGLHENYPENDQFIQGAKTEYLDIKRKQSLRNDVSIDMFNIKGEMFGRFEYNNKLYSKETILKYIQNYIKTIEIIVNNPELKMKELKSYYDREK